MKNVIYGLLAAAALALSLSGSAPAGNPSHSAPAKVSAVIQDDFVGYHIVWRHAFLDDWTYIEPANVIADINDVPAAIAAAQAAALGQPWENDRVGYCSVRIDTYSWQPPQ
jgi:hypothetical protein